MNLWQLACDAANALRLRFNPAAAYRYPVSVVLAVLLALSLLNAAGMTNTLGTQHGNALLALSAVVTVARWLGLSFSAGKLGGYYSGVSQPFGGYVLATEALSLPMVAVFYVPELQSVSLFWGVWTLFVQLSGLRRLSGCRGWQVLLIYLLGLLIALVLSLAGMTVLAVSGLIDIEALSQSFNSVLQTAPAVK